MQIKINLPDEYWYGLTYLATKCGFPTRQEFVAEHLKVLLERDVECHSKGKEEKVLMDQRKSIMSDAPRVMDAVPMQVKKHYFEITTWQWIVEFMDPDRKGEIVQGVTDKNEVFKRLYGRYPMDDHEFNKRIKSCYLK